ncbi:hypothetical protein CAOG_01156 [Capsaspora owczarzaki ATCC 30864]|nr:hypothetical protein CAOG_01156 [Capsaspora owczarzaki ATCC 30864]|eukprot:XP_004366027.2 hypothetical protein CAOG_01156 [Capsaspora owczarzaki ATCC 30864]
MPFGVSSRFSSSSAPTLMPQPSSSLTLTMPTRSFFGQANNRSVSFPSAINPQPQSRAQDGTAANGSRLDGFLDRFKYQEQGSGRSTKSATSDGGEPGTHDAPIVVEVAQGSFKSQLFSLARQLIMVTVLMAYLSTMLEERTGMSKSMNQHNEVQPDTNSDCRFADVAGVDEAKEELTEIVEYLKDPEKFQRLGGRLPKGVLLYGPPGTGKTLLAKAISNEAKASFFYASGSEFDELFVGVGSKRIRELFAQAKRKSPAIIFIDEIDAIGASRTTRDQQFSKMTLNQLLIEMDGFKQNDGVIVIAATNFPELLDKALVRPGRFDRHVTVPLPDVLGRKQILDVHTKDIPVAKNVDLSIIARGTPGFSGAELAEVVNQAALKASVEGDKVVTMAHLEYAKDKIIMGAERKSAVIDDSVRKITAYHEGGHALVALMSHGAHPVHKATIMPRGRALGMVAQLPEKDEISTTRRQLLARLEVCMGGRVAEELIFGHDNITSGASSDIASATSLARAMVTQYGMSEKIGPVLHREEDMDKLSPETLAVIESEVKALVETAYKNATQMLRTNSTELHRIAQALIEYETLNGEELKLIVQGKSIPRDPVTPKKQ